MKEKILFIQHYGLGDVILSLPAVKAVREYKSASEIFLFISKNYSELGEFLPYVDRILFFENTSVQGRIKELIELRKNYHFDISFILNPLLYGGIIAYLSGAVRRIGYYRDFERQQKLFFLKYILLTDRLRPREEDIYEVERYLDVIRQGLKLNKPLPVNNDYLIVKEAHHQLFEEIKKSIGLPENSFLLTLCPQSSVKQKEWNYENYLKVFNDLCEKYNFHILILGTHKDDRIKIEDYTHLKNRMFDLRGRTSLRDLVILITHSNLVLTVDNGTMHIAALLNKPTIAIFGPSNQKKFKHPNVDVISENCDCSPCSRAELLRCKDNRCMKQINVEMVKQVLIKKIETIWK